MPTLSFDLLWKDRGASQGMKNLGTTTEKTGKSFKALKVVGAAALVAVAAGAVKFGKDSVKAYAESEDAQKSLAFAFSKFPALADTNQAALQRLNSALQKKTRFDDDNIASGQAVLAQFKLTGKQLTEVTPLLVDYASKTGKDIPKAATDVGKALLGNAKALKNIGISYKSTGDAGKDFTNITALMREKVGGFAEREGSTASGRLAILKNQFGELQEVAGSKLVPALTKVVGGLTRLVGFVQDLSPLFGSFGRIAKATFGAFSEAVGGGKASFKNFGDYIETHQAGIITGFVKTGKAALGIGQGILTAASVGLRGFAVIMDAQKNSTAGFLFGFGQIVKGAALAFGWIPGIGPKLKASEVQFAMFSRSALIGMDKAADGARNAADGIDNKLKPALDRAGRKLDEVGKKEIIKAGVRDAVKKAALAIQDLGTKSDGSQVKLKKFADRSKLSADESRGLHNRLSGVRGALRDQLGAMRDAGAGQGKLSKAWEVGRDRLYKEFRQMGLSREEARKLAKQYAGIKPKVSTKVEQPGMDAARRKTKGLDDDINDLNSKSVSVKVRYSASGKVTVGSIKDRKLANLKAAAGGVLPGWSPGRDVHHFRSPTAGDLALSGGEGILIPQATKAIGGPTGIKRINDAARKGQPYTQAFESGGVFRTIKVHGDTNAPPDPLGRYESAVDSAGRYAGRIAVARARELAKAEADRQRAAIKRAKAAAASSGSGASVAAGPGWGPIMAVMRKYGARNFNTYPGHHPSAARARDVTPHNQAMANAVKALSSVWYVIYRMRIASKNHGNGWRQYHPISNTGDWRHVNHIHVARYGNGTDRARRGLAVVGEHGPELVRMNGGERVTPSREFVRVGGGGARGGGGKTELHFHFDRFVGSPNDLKREMVAMYRRGDLDVIVGRR